ncbi:glycosyl transferase [Spirochaetia bacterium]|nr:glycosyl transferase [Spirochaetia bacterium]
MNSPIISIIVPIYKTEHYIARCLDSLISQTFSNIEIICVNDGSPDNALAICEDYAKREKRISVFSQTNQGPSAARNTGLLHAQGEYIQFCDSDDYYDITMCEKMYNAIITSKADICVSGINIFYDNMPAFANEHYYQAPFHGIRLIDYEVFTQTNVFVWNKIYKKSLIDKYSITFPYGLHYEDACFLFKYLMISKKIYFISDLLYTYIIRPDSIMGSTRFTKPAYAIDHIYIIQDVAYFMAENGLEKKFEHTFIWMTLLYVHLSCWYGPDVIYEKTFEAGAALLNNIDFNAILCGNYSMDDVIRLYALKKKDSKMYFSANNVSLQERVLSDIRNKESLGWRFILKCIKTRLLRK